MSQQGEVLKINIYGTEYPIKSDPDTNAEYIMKVAEYVDHKMREIEQSTQAKSALKVAILAALNITDELFQERAKENSPAPEVDVKIKTLSESLERILEQASR